jgi:hypothetical protein
LLQRGVSSEPAEEVSGLWGFSSGEPVALVGREDKLASEVRHVVPQPKLATAIDCYFLAQAVSSEAAAT